MEIKIGQVVSSAGQTNSPLKMEKEITGLDGSFISVSSYEEVGIDTVPSNSASYSVSSNKIPSVSAPNTTTTVIKKGPVTFCCSVCGYTSKHSSNVKRHFGVHNSELRFKCHVCPRSYTANGKLKSHIAEKHTANSKKKMCHVCGKLYETKEGLRNHIGLKHLGMGRFKCPVCDKAFNAGDLYRGHLSKHSRRKDHRCPKCRRYFQYERNLKSHIRDCHAEKKTTTHTCETCGVSFDKKSTLITHTRGNHSKLRYRCPCGKSYKWRSSRSKHETNCPFTRIS